MSKKIVRATLRNGQALLLPPEAGAVLGQDNEIFIAIDEENKTVTLSLTDPEVLENEAILDQLAALNEGLTLEEYGEPVPESFLHRRGKTARDGGGK